MPVIDMPKDKNGEPFLSRKSSNLARRLFAIQTKNISTTPFNNATEMAETSSKLFILGPYPGLILILHATVKCRVPFLYFDEYEMRSITEVLSVMVSLPIKSLR